MRHGLLGDVEWLDWREGMHVRQLETKTAEIPMGRAQRALHLRCCRRKAQKVWPLSGWADIRPSVANLRKQWGAEPVNLVERMWAQDPAQRPTMTDVVHDLEALIADL